MPPVLRLKRLQEPSPRQYRNQSTSTGTRPPLGQKTHLLRDIGHSVKNGVHGVNVAEGHKRTVRQLTTLVELAPLQAGLKDVQRGDLMRMMPGEGLGLMVHYSKLFSN